ncbi:MFS transporter [Labedaea rhizosphaerae]|uniref:Transmembrane secretion effector n=1 Tax=Labedaea rhizosphaerae TaxID=598644 RepID=A0A4R6S185_LABRH|nr:MFS transporter [Labedaea rhizosphaerae]TDP92954.1 transmembrane secretion effector [Labedaea rhizosphaerae]
MRAAWNLLARNRNYRLLVTAHLISAGGDWILGVGMTFIVYRLTGSALASGTMLLMSFLPQFLLGSVGGVFADRWDRRRTMIITNALLAASLLPLLLVHDPDQVWLLYVAVFVEGAIAQFFAPAEAAMVATVVPERDLVAANALNGQTQQLARLGGAGLGGAIAAASGLTALVLVDVTTYALATVLVAMITVAKKPAPAEPVTKVSLGLRAEWLDGLRLCLTRRDLSTLLVYRVLSGLGEGIFGVLLAPLVVGVLQASGGEYGFVVAMQAIGGVAGGLAVAALSHRIAPTKLLGYGVLVFGALDLAIAVYPLALPMLWPTFVLITVVGLPAAGVVASFNSLQQLWTPDEYRGRVFGAISAGWAVAVSAGTVLAGFLGDEVGIIPVLAVQGVIHLLLAPFVLVRWSRKPDAVPAVLVAEGSVG